MALCLSEALLLRDPCKVISKAASSRSVTSSTETSADKDIDEDIADLSSSALSSPRDFEELSSTVRSLCPPPGLKPAQALVTGQLGAGAAALHQIHWSIDLKKFSSQDRSIVSPSFDLLLGSAPTNASFRIMIQAADHSDQHKGMSFKASHGRGRVQMKCETPDFEDIQFRLKIGTSRYIPSCGFLTHDFSKATVCELELADFRAASDANANSANVTICMEVLACRSFCPTLALNGVVEKDRNSPRPTFEKKMKIKEPVKSTTLVSPESLKTQPCRFYTTRKGCAKGATCPYAHGASELCANARASPFYKTRLCAMFTRIGSCSLGDQCTFAHGNSELCQP